MNVSEGIRIFDHNTVANNTLTLCEIGIHLFQTYYALVENNTCTLNDEGIILTSSAKHNDIIGNILDSNLLNAKDNGEDNFFGTNYWSNYTGTDDNGDGIGDVPHPIDGIAATEDPHPLMTSSTPRIGMNWDNTLLKQIVELGNGFRYDLNCTGSEPIYWWLDGGGWGTWMTIDQDGVITNSSNIDFISSKLLEVSGRNIYSFFITTTLNITIQDTIQPTWDDTPENQIIEYGSAFSVKLNASDIRGVSYWINDTINFNLEDYSITASNLPVGTYGIEARAIDPGGLYVTTTFRVTCQDTIMPVINHPEDIELTEFEAGAMAYVDITWTAGDLSSLTYVILLDGVESQTGTLTNSITFQVNLGMLNSGTYNYTISITDAGGNQVSDTVLVVITPTPTDSTPTDTTTTSDPPDTIDYSPVLFIGIGGGVVIVGAIILMKRR